MKNLEMPKGKIYGDTLNINEKLDIIELIDIDSKNEFYEALIDLSNIIDLSKYKKFIYQDYNNIFDLEYKEIKNNIKKGK